MAAPSSGLLILPEAPTGLLVTLGVLAAALVLLALRGIVDWLGPAGPTATYRLVQAGEGIAIAETEEAQGQRLIGLDDDEMLALIEAAEHRNEIRLHEVVAADGQRAAWEAWRFEEERAAPASVVIEDSKGTVEVHASGRIEAQPPLDDAVRGDLIEVLGEVLGPA